MRFYTAILFVFVDIIDTSYFSVFAFSAETVS